MRRSQLPSRCGLRGGAAFAARRACDRSVRRDSPIRRISRRSRRGRYLAIAADCASLPHRARQRTSRSPADAPSKRRSATSSRRTSRPTARPASARGPMTQFDSALRQGIRPNGARLYPAMPYTAYTKMSRDDVLAIRAYLNTVEPVHNRSSPIRCRFRSTSAPRCGSGTGSISPRASSSPIRNSRPNGIAAHSWSRARPLRRLPYAEIFSGRRQDQRISARLVPAGLVRARHHQ